MWGIPESVKSTTYRRDEHKGYAAHSNGLQAFQMLLAKVLQHSNGGLLAMILASACSGCRWPTDANVDNVDWFIAGVGLQGISMHILITSSSCVLEKEITRVKVDFKL